MTRKTIWLAALMAGVFSSGYLAGRGGAPLVESATASEAGRVYEMRTYYTHPGKLDDLNKRFRDHTLKFFEKHGMTNVGYWVPQDSAKGSHNTLVYIISHASREQARENWRGFSADPGWRKVAQESEANGKIVQRVESVFLDPTDYSPIR